MTKLLISLVLMVVVVTACGPNRMNAKRGSQADPPQAALSDDELINIAVCERLIRDVLNRSPGEYCFVAANDKERQSLSLRFPRITLLPGEDAEKSEEGVRAKRTKKSGLLFSVLSKRIVGNRAFVHAGYLGKGAAVSFDFELKKDHDWNIEKVGNPIVADLPPPQR
jgi:hypothetical protein